MRYILALFLIATLCGTSSAAPVPTLKPEGPRVAGHVDRDYHFSGSDAALYSQPPDINGLVMSSEIISAVGLESELADDFILSGTPNTPVTVTRIRWWGGPFNYTPGDPLPTSFLLNFYDDAGCIPASPVAQILVPNDAHATDLGMGGNGVPVFEYYADVSIALLAGRPYWIGIQAGDHPFPPQWGRLEAASLVGCGALFRSAFFGYPDWTRTIDLFGSDLDASLEIEGQSGSTAGTITGKVFDDIDADCAQGQGEPDLRNQRVFLVEASQIQTTAADGTYGFAGVVPGPYTVSLLPRVHWEQTCPPNGADQQVTAIAGQVTSGVDFGTRGMAGYQDLSVRLGAARARSGFPTYYEVDYRNLGTTTISATLVLTLPPSSDLTYNSSNPPGSFSNQTVTWNLGPLPPDAYGIIYVYATVNLGAPFGSHLTTSAEITPLAGDANPLDNDASVDQLVRSSWDPNDKIVVPAGAIEGDAVLHYHVDFQNVGNAEATNIVVRDTLDTGLDITSVAFGTASHANTAQINGRTLVWTFANINLPDSTSDLAGSQGFAEFTATPVAGLPIGTEIKNHASIYFDFNPAVVTNVVTSTIAPPSNRVDAGEASSCISTINPCVEVPVVFHRTDNSALRLAHVVFQLSPQLELCDPGDLGASVLTAPESSDWLFDGFANSLFHVTDNGGGSYTVDGTLLGSPCGITATGDKILFKLMVKASGTANPEDTGTVTVTAVAMRGCSNEFLSGIPGGVRNLQIDRAQAAATALSGSQVKSGNDTDGTTKITVSFTPPSAGDYQSTDVYRHGFGNYPEYDDAPGAGGVPSIPATPTAALAEGWTLVGTSISDPLLDEPSTRDFYYYVAFSMDECGNVSAPSNRSGGTLNYYLGDVAPGSGNNAVSGLDISLLGNDYGKTSGFDPVVDVGPTTDYSVDGRPLTDDRIDFEDLIMFSINYGNAAFNGPVYDWAGGAGRPHDTVPVLKLAWENVARGSTPGGSAGFATAKLVLQDNQDLVKGVHALLSYDPAVLHLIDVTPGILAGQGDVFFKSLSNPAGIVVDAAKLGQGLTIHGDGEIAIVRFRVIGAGARPALAGVSLRGQNNEFLEAVHPVSVLSKDPTIAPAGVAATRILGAQPNPFHGRTEIRFEVAAETPVRLRVFDASGRLVRTLIDRVLSPGEYSADWDGRFEDGRQAGSGVFFYTFSADGKEASRKMILLQ